MDKINEEKAKENLINLLFPKLLFPKFPTTDEEIDEFEKENDINSVELPECLKDPMQILKKNEKTT
jgi:hypothetical protein